MSERVVRIGYIREHFSVPLLLLADNDAGKTFTLVECPSGTGQVISRLRNDEIDVAIALTDPLLAGIANGTSEGAYKLVGSYVTSPLNWAVVTGKDSKYQNIADLRGTTIGISRAGSGSQTMASVMALQQGWTDPATGNVEKLNFQINNDINGLNASVNDGSTSAYMWEWFTTKPWADRGEVRFIGSVPTPWPSWMIAAHPSPSRAPPEFLRSFLDKLSASIHKFTSSFPVPEFSPLSSAAGAASVSSISGAVSPLSEAAPSGSGTGTPTLIDTVLKNATEAVGGIPYKAEATATPESDVVDAVKLIIDRFGYPEADVKAWLAQVTYTTDAREVSEKVIRDTITVLGRAGVVSPAQSLDASLYVNESIAKLVASP